MPTTALCCSCVDEALLHHAAPASIMPYCTMMCLPLEDWCTLLLPVSRELMHRAAACLEKVDAPCCCMPREGWSCCMSREGLWTMMLHVSRRLIDHVAACLEKVDRPCCCLPREGWWTMLLPASRMLMDHDAAFSRSQEITMWAPSKCLG